MRATPTEQKGAIGSNEVSGKFERLNWGVAPNPDHDLGTDLYLSPRDERYFDLRVVIGAQVKAGPSYFEEPVTDDATGEVTGWWFRKATLEHFVYWVDHTLPHLIVLYDIETSTAYWEHLTRESVTFLKKGAKVFVPASQVVSQDNAQALREVALDGFVPQHWQGTAWTGLANMSSTEQLRYALLTPRLVAPHPNQGATEMTPPQALAAVVLCRLEELTHPDLPGGGRTPDLSALPEGSGWAWHLVAGLYDFVRTGSYDKLQAAVESAIEPHEQAAATAALSAALIEDNEAAKAQTLLTDLLHGNLLGPVDHAWVLVQRARAAREVGDVDTARDGLAALINLPATSRNDLTAAAVAAAAANTVFSMSKWEAKDIGSTIAATDTASTWWRQQLKSWGLTSYLQTSFSTWANDRSLTLGATDQAWRQLRATNLIDGLAGDHALWRRSHEELALYVIVSSDNIESEAEQVDRVAGALEMLRVAGATKSLRLASARVMENGPAEAVRRAAAEVRPELSTATTAHADLTVVAAAARFLSSQRAHELAQWCMDIASDPAPYMARTRPGFDVVDEVLKVLGALSPSLDHGGRSKVLDWILSLPAQKDQGRAQRLGSVLGGLPESVWDSARASVAADRADDDPELKYAILEAVAPLLPEVRERLVREAADGSWRALTGVGSVTELDPEIVRSLMQHAADGVDSTVAQAKHGTHSRGVTDPAFILTVLNIWHPNLADWAPLIRLFAEVDHGDDLHRALEALGSNVENIPAEVADTLLPLMDRIACLEGGRVTTFAFHDARPTARQVAAALREAQALSPGHDPVTLSAMLRGSAEHRRSAVRLCRRPNDGLTLGILATLTGDSAPEVRGLAATVVVERASEGDVACLRLLPDIGSDPGRRVPLALASAARTHPNPAVLEALSGLAEHPLADVREIYGQAVDRAGRAGTPSRRETD